MERVIEMKGKWIIIATDIRTGKKHIAFHDGFDTKKEALEMCERMDQVVLNFKHKVVKEPEERMEVHEQN